jgi:hypothetical protein
MKNITLSMDDDLASWVRVEAAKAGKSVSRYLADMLAEKRGPKVTQKESARRFLGGAGFPGVTKDLPSRAELYDEILLYRHQRAPLRPGSERPRKADGRR